MPQVNPVTIPSNATTSPQPAANRIGRPNDSRSDPPRDSHSIARENKAPATPPRMPAAGASISVAFNDSVCPTSPK